MHCQRSVQEQAKRRVSTFNYDIENFEEQRITIMEFTNSIINKNNDRNCHLDRTDIDLCWTMEVDSLYPAGGVIVDNLIDQVSSVLTMTIQARDLTFCQTRCPLYERFWEEKMNMDAFLVPGQMPDGFKESRTLPSRAEKTTFPGCICLVNDKTDVLVPAIFLLPFPKVQLETLVFTVFRANHDKQISRLDMLDVWKCVIFQIFGHEDEESKRLKAQQVSLSSPELLFNELILT